MRETMSLARLPELVRFTELTAKVGRDPLLTQASAGNSSIKLGGEMWIKASGRWMAAALRDEIFIPLSLAMVEQCLVENKDPADYCSGASLETAMHALLPHRVVLHTHSVNTIVWAVRADGYSELQERLNGLRWQWIPYLPSGLPLARGIDAAIRRRPETEIFVLANHGLVIGANDVQRLETLLAEVERRLHVSPRFAHPADYAVLSSISEDSEWDVPEDDGIHALGTDSISRRIVAGGILYPCQAMFSGGRGLRAFRPIRWESRVMPGSGNSPFLIVEGCGVLVRRDTSPAGLAMLSGLAEVTQRLGGTIPIRYLTEREIAGLSPQSVDRYCRLANSAVANG